MPAALRTITLILAVTSPLSAFDARAGCEATTLQSVTEQFRDLFAPDTCYRYFARGSAEAFRPEATGYDPVNAAWLADMALLAYVPTGEEQAQNGGKFDWDYLNGRGWTSSFVDDALHQAGLSVRYFGYDRSGTQAFVAHNDVFVAVVFRGTEVKDLVDLLTDGIALPRWERAMAGWVHSGFAQALDSVWPDIQAYLEQVAVDKPVWFTGHSLGAAIAVLAAGRWAAEHADQVGGLYTFGSPGVGDDKFTSAVEDRVPAYRLINHNDLVTTVNLTHWMNPVGRETRRIGTGETIAVSEAETLTSAVLPSVAKVGQFIFDLPTKFKSWQDGSLPGDLRDHAPRHYAQVIWASIPD